MSCTGHPSHHFSQPVSSCAMMFGGEKEIAELLQVEVDPNHCVATRVSREAAAAALDAAQALAGRLAGERAHSVSLTHLRSVSHACSTAPARLVIGRLRRRKEGWPTARRVPVLFRDVLVRTKTWREAPPATAHSRPLRQRGPLTDAVRSSRHARSDVGGLAAEAHARGVPLAVDEAHGSHFGCGSASA